MKKHAGGIFTAGAGIRAGGRKRRSPQRLINQWRYQNERNFNETVT